MPQNCSRNSEGNTVLDWSKSKQGDNIKMDFEDIFVNVYLREFFRNVNEVSLTTEGDVNLLTKYGDLPLLIKHVMCNTILSPIVVVTVCTICRNINKT
jgi:hypothetical protein